MIRIRRLREECAVKRLVSLMMVLLCLMGCIAMAESEQHVDAGIYANTYPFVQSAPLKMRLATRSGPSTQYDELGSFLKTGENVDVISKAYDEENGIWWLQVGFSANGKKYRAYTGLKRVDIDVDTVPEEQPMGRIRVNAATIPYCGPGEDYMSFNKEIPAGWNGTVYAQEDGWMQIEFCLAKNESYRRVWLPQSCVTTTTVY